MPLGDAQPPRHPQMSVTLGQSVGTWNELRFATDFGVKISKNFRGRRIFRLKSREIAPKSIPLCDAQLPRHCQRSTTTVRSVGTLRRVRFRAIRNGFRTEIFENFSRPQNFRSRSREIAPKSMPAVDAQPCHDPQRSRTTVLSVGMLRRVRFRPICNGFRTEIFEKILIFAAAKFLREITPESVPLDDAQARHDP